MLKCVNDQFAQKEFRAKIPIALPKSTIQSRKAQFPAARWGRHAIVGLAVRNRYPERKRRETLCIDAACACFSSRVCYWPSPRPLATHTGTANRPDTMSVRTFTSIDL